MNDDKKKSPLNSKNPYYINFKENEKQFDGRNSRVRRSLNTKKNLDRIVQERKKKAQEDAQKISETEQESKIIEPRRRIQTTPTIQFSSWLRGGNYGTKHKADSLILYIALLLIAIGLVMVYSSSSYKALLESGTPAFYFTKQFKFMLIGLIGMWIAFRLPIAITEQFAIHGFILSIVMLLAVMAFGKNVDGATRWIEIGGTQFTPSDITKLFGIVFFAQFLRGYNMKKISIRDYFIVLVVFAILPGLIVIEDLGTGVTLAGALFVMMVLSGVPVRYLGWTIAGGIGAVLLAIIIEPYRIKRIIGFIDPFSSENIANGGWQLVQSLYAFASGGLFGSGLGNGGQKLLYLPAMHTDFIFSVYAEEMGFIGSVFLLLLFVAFVIRGLMIANRLQNSYMSLVAAGLTSVIGIQALINISVTVGVFPVTGITLPFISYGGTSLIVMMTIVGFLLNLSQYTKK